MQHQGIVNLSGRGMLVVSVARQLGSGNSFDRLLCCPAQAERGRKRCSGSAKLTMPAQEMAAHESPRTTKLYDRTKERLTQDEVEKIRL
jgi:hypothetical protein